MIISGLVSLYFALSAIAFPLLAHNCLYDWAGKIDYLLFEACHRQPTRSFWLYGYPVSLCCRCLGFYFSAALSVVLFYENIIKLNFNLFITAVVIAFVDISLNLFLNIDTHNPARFFAGICLGYVFVSVIQFVLGKGEVK